MRAIKRHIIHCSDSTHGNAAEIRRWHVARGWQDIGYHFVILPDGTVETGRPLIQIGAHCQGHNADSVGTCLIGKQSFTQVQFSSLRALHRGLCAALGELTVHGHREFTTGKTCPNFDVADVF